MNELIPVEYRAERVLTTEQLAQAYECEPKQIKQNFNTVLRILKLKEVKVILTFTSFCIYKHLF